MSSPILRIKATCLDAVDWFNEKVDPFHELSRKTRLLGGGIPLDTEAHMDLLAEEHGRRLEDFMSGPGYYLYQKPTDMGDLCIWQGVYTAACLFAAAAESDLDLRLGRERRAALSIRALSQFTKPFLLRGATPSGATLGSPGSTDTPYLKDPAWADDYFMDGGQHLRQDASLDSLAGYLFGMTSALRLISIKAGPTWYTAHTSVGNFYGSFRSAGYKLVNRDGSPTRYGNCSPGVFQGPVRNLAAALSARLAAGFGHVSNDEWHKIAKKYGKDFERTGFYFGHKHGWYNDNMAAMLGVSYCMLVGPNEPGGAEAREGLKRLLRQTRKHGNAFFVYLAKLVGVDSPHITTDRADSMLIEFGRPGILPDGKTAVEILNSKDPALETVRWYRFGEKKAAQSLPAWRRPAADFVWQRDPFSLDGWVGVHTPTVEYNGLDYLVTYWLRKVVKEAIRK
jgi:hypothetical protein